MQIKVGMFATGFARFLLTNWPGKRKHVTLRVAMWVPEHTHIPTSRHSMACEQ